MSVSVTRDRWGIGHASAPSATEAFWAQGWMAADDRIWQMEWDRRRAAGRWAEVVGSAGVKEDRFFRRLDLPTVAQADWAALTSAAREMTEAYAAGVNAWLDDPSTSLPEEFEFHPAPPERWEPWHCVVVYKVRHLFMGTFHRKLWRGAVLATAGVEATMAMRGDPSRASAMVPGPGTLPSPDLLADAAEVMAMSAEDLAAVAETDGGSNSWAVHGSRTDTGLPYLAGDPHRGIEFPNVYYQCHIACDEFDAIGLSFPGVPGFPHFGHNRDVAWCITHGMADDTDVFVETDPASIDWDSETIEVKGAEPETVSCGRSARGPVVLGEPEDGAVLSMNWTGMSGVDTTIDALRPMLSADGVDALEEAVRPWVIPVNNLLTADVAGDISFKIRGRVVERPPASRWTPVAGTDEFSWDGCDPVAYDDLPAWRNPDRGFLVTANNRTADAGPYVSLDFIGPARHDRIVQRLEALDRATAADMRSIHADVESLVAPAVCRVLVDAEPASDLGRQAQALLDGWNHRIEADSAAACVYNATRRHWSVAVANRLGLTAPRFGGDGWPDPVGSTQMMFGAATTLLVNGTWSVVPGLDADDDLRTELGAAIDAASAELAEILGPDPSSWRWVELHTIVSPHPLASVVAEAEHLHPPTDGCPGDGDTVRAGGVAPANGDRASSASVGRYVFDLSDWDASGWVVPHGVSGVRRSGHDLDQRSAWLACELIPMPYSPDAVAAHAKHTFTLG